MIAPTVTSAPRSREEGSAARRRWGPRTGTLLSVLAFSGVAAEAYLRVFWPVDYLAPQNRLSHRDRKVLLHRPSLIPGLPYEMVPGLSIELAGVPVGINSLGMRDDEPLAMKGDAVVRIAAVGDSVTFGAGVTQDEAWPSVLERLLNDGALGQGRRYEVLNFGVNGYTSRDEALVARHKVLPLEPDLVVFGYVLNDPEIAPVQPMQAYFREVAWWRHSDLLRLIAHRIHQRAVEKHGGYIEYLHAEEGPGWKSVLRAFGDIVAATGSQDVPVLMIIFPLAIWPKYPHGDIHARVAASAQALGIEVLDLGPVLTDVGAKELRLPEGHPNPLGHRLTAEAVRDWLVENPGVFVVEPARKIEAP